MTGTDGGPFQTYPRPAATIITGDFNMDPDDPGHAQMLAPFADGTPALRRRMDARAPGRAACADDVHLPEDRPDGARILLRLHLRQRELEVAGPRRHRRPQLQASDHQPVVLTLD